MRGSTGSGRVQHVGTGSPADRQTEDVGVPRWASGSRPKEFLWPGNGLGLWRASGCHWRTAERLVLCRDFAWSPSK